MPRKAAGVGWRWHLGWAAAASAELASGLCHGCGQKLPEDAGRGEDVFTGPRLTGAPL